jgi:hypothetical protein
MFFKREQDVLPHMTTRGKFHSKLKGILWDTFYPDIIREYKINEYDDVTKVYVHVDGKRLSSKDDIYLAYLDGMIVAMKGAILAYREQCKQEGIKPVKVMVYYIPKNDFVSHVDVQNFNTQVIKWGIQYPYDKEIDPISLEPIIS